MFDLPLLPNLELLGEEYYMILMKEVLGNH